MLGRMRRRRRRTGSVELDITAFLNLMVILVPFLLITAVFSRITVLDLYLPPESNAQSMTKNRFQLEVIIREQGFTVQERGSGFLQQVAKKKSVYDLEKLSLLIRQLKQNNPTRQDASILAEPDIEYDTLVQVMDVVRMRVNKQSGNTEFEELFPNISIGDAPGRSS